MKKRVRTCLLCGETLPLESKYFHQNIYSKLNKLYGGFAGVCRTCLTAYCVSMAEQHGRFKALDIFCSIIDRPFIMNVAESVFDDEYDVQLFISKYMQKINLHPNGKKTYIDSDVRSKGEQNDSNKMLLNELKRLKRLVDSSIKRVEPFVEVEQK